MFEAYIRIIGIINGVLTAAFVVSLFYQYKALKHNNHEASYGAYRIQSLFIAIFHFLSFTILMNEFDYSREVILIYLGSLGLIILVNVAVDHLMPRSQMPLWTISQYLVTVGLVILTRLDMGLGLKQLYIAAGAYVATFIIAWLITHVTFIKYLGIPAIILAYALLLMTNATFGGATNWLKIGDFIFQPSEIVKVLYIVFLASSLILFREKEKYALVGTGLVTVGLVFIQVFQNDLGSALIFYVVFILMSYVYTTNRSYIILGFLATAGGGFIAFNQFSHVRIRVEAWLDPWVDIDNKGYQIAQSLFALGNGGLFGSGLTLGQPYKIPVVTTDFIYSAIFEEFGLIVGISLIVIILYFLLFGLLMVEKTPYDFEFLLGSGLLVILAFQSFLIIGGVTKLVPLTGVTLPFVSYGGSSLVTSFIMLGILQGIGLAQQKKKQGMGNEENKKRSTSKKK